jgi:transcriptional regulator with XRE-family HTH domain
MKTKTALSLDLVKRRTELGMTQVALANALGVHPLTVSRWERSTQKVGHPRLVLAYLALLELRHQQQDRASVDVTTAGEVR